MMTDLTCSCCGASSADRAPDDVWRVNVTMPTVGVVDLCEQCWDALVAFCAGWSRAR